MPLISIHSDLHLNDDIKYEGRDPLTGEVKQEANYYPDIKLTYGDSFDYNPTSEGYKKYVIRGTPNPIKLWWDGETRPVFRVVTEKLNDDGWKRLIRLYQGNRGTGGEVIYFEPDLTDVQMSDDPDKQWQFPLWVLDKFKELGAFEEALVNSKVGLSQERCLTKQRYDLLMERLEERRAKELVKSTKASNTKTSVV